MRVGNLCETPHKALPALTQDKTLKPRAKYTRSGRTVQYSCFATAWTRVGRVGILVAKPIHEIPGRQTEQHHYDTNQLLCCEVESQKLVFGVTVTPVDFHDEALDGVKNKIKGKANPHK